MRKLSKFLIIVFVALIALSSVFALSVEVVEDGHDCAGESCPICAVCSVCDQLKKNLNLPTTACTVLAIAAFALVSVAFFSGFASPTETLVKLKVKLSD